MVYDKIWLSNFLKGDITVADINEECVQETVHLPKISRITTHVNVSDAKMWLNTPQLLVI